MKQRNKIYTLAAMEPGDRFYFFRDTQKRVYELGEPPFETTIQKGFWKRYANCRQPGSLKQERHLVTRQVIFLRNINA
jgi:hypothetical protein